ncbi:flagellin [Parvularcula dongshanensis]|uniref:Flagellin n=1 Tax=Parvularcula dongshanensis TaxID=1173995 RepID=A0A840I671_9PROT|nr:flagellin [Parvularcula dongshanensis]MBB4659638.1 flagellin [Parvularcula dongshanensis]
MTSINTNQSAMVALDTLQNINKSLQTVQSQISTGRKINTARDNAAVWAISTTMESDVAAFKTITDSLNLGAATVGVARSASETVTGLLKEMKSLIVSAAEENVDRTKIQTDITALRNQIADTVDAAQFNGLNLLKGGDSVSLLSSLNRDASNNVTADKIAVNRVDLTETAGVASTTNIASGEAGFVTDSGSGTLADGSGTPTTATLTFTGGDLAAGDLFSLTAGGVTVEYTASAGDTAADVASALKTAAEADAGFSADVALAISTSGDDTVLTVTNSGAATSAYSATAKTGGTAAGGLSGLADIDVTTTEGAAAALTSIETMLNTAIDASAGFGSAQKRVDIQNDFIGSLIDSLEIGVSALTDANLEEASARLQALQVQQQLGLQSLSIANQAPQSILSLFR